MIYAMSLYITTEFLRELIFSCSQPEAA